MLDVRDVVVVACCARFDDPVNTRLSLVILLQEDSTMTQILGVPIRHLNVCRRPGNSFGLSPPTYCRPKIDTLFYSTFLAFKTWFL